MNLELIFESAIKKSLEHLALEHSNLSKSNKPLCDKYALRIIHSLSENESDRTSYFEYYQKQKKERK